MGLNKQQRLYEKSLNTFTGKYTNSQASQFKDLEFKTQTDCAIHWLARHRDICMPELGHATPTVFVDPNEITYLAHTFFAAKENDFISVLLEYLIDLFVERESVADHFEVKLSLILTELYTQQSFTAVRQGKFSMRSGSNQPNVSHTRLNRLEVI